MNPQDRVTRKSFQGERLSIGELSSISGIPVSTLRYYDEIDLLTPAEVDPVTQYRYYRSVQLYDVNFIESWKRKGFSLKEIQSFLKDENSAPPVESYTRQISLVESKIRILQKQRELMDRNLQLINRFSSISDQEYQNIKVVKKAPEISLTARTNEAMDFRNYTENWRLLEELYFNSDYNLPQDAVFSSTQYLEPVEEKQRVLYRLPILIKDTCEKGCIRTRPSHYAVSVYHNGSFLNREKTVRRLLNYIKVENLSVYNLINYSYWIHTPITLNEDLHVTEISIPLKKYNYS